MCDNSIDPLDEATGVDIDAFPDEWEPPHYEEGYDETYDGNDHTGDLAATGGLVSCAPDE